MRRHALTDEQWAKIEAILDSSRPGPKPRIGDRAFIDAVLYRAKTGVPWRDLPERFGPWKSVYNRFNEWSKRGRWEAIFKAVQTDIDPDGSMADGSVRLWLFRDPT